MTFIISTRQLMGAVLASALFFSACKKPNEGINIAYNSDIMKYQALVQFQDAVKPGIVPAGISISIYGPDAANVYNSGGKRSFSVSADGKLNIGIGPSRQPLAGNPVVFYVQARANGYVTNNQKVVISAGQMAQVITVKLMSITAPPAGYKVTEKTFTLSNGVLGSPAELGSAFNEKGFGHIGDDIAQNSSGNAVSNMFSIAYNNVANKVSGFVEQLKQAGEKLMFGAAPPPGDTTYYDDGNATVVLPKGTTFYYLKPMQVVDTVVSDVFNVTTPGKWVTDSSVTTGQTTTKYRHYVPAVGYYTKETREFPRTEWERVPYTGSKMKISLVTEPGADVSISLYPYDEFGNTVQSYKIANGQTVREDELLFSTAVKEKVIGVTFSAMIDSVEYTISPDESVNWYSSLVLNDKFVNPQTNKAIQEGDLIEVGIDPTTGETVTAPIKKAANGQLRVEEQFGNAGYYYKAPYTLSYNNTYTSSLSTDVIPDQENAWAYAVLRLAPGVSFSASFMPNTGSVNFAGKISASVPVTNTSEVQDYYFGSYYKGNSTDAFAPLKSATLNPVITFNITATCPSKEKTIYPTYFGYDKWSGHYFYVVNGLWKTRGLKLGDSFTLDGELGNTEILQDISINTYEVNVSVNSDSPDFCKNF